MASPDDVLSVDDAAAELGISVRRVRALIDGGYGKLKAKRIGVSWVILRQDLDAVRVRKDGRPRKKPK